MYLYILSNQVPLERKKKYVMIRKEVSEENGGMHYARKSFFRSYCIVKDSQFAVMRGNVVNLTYQ